jgi:hypothetical protein
MVVHKCIMVCWSSTLMLHPAPTVQASPARQCRPPGTPSHPRFRFVTLHSLPTSLHHAPYRPHTTTPHASAAMRALPTASAFLALIGLAAADDLVTKGRIKVQLFAAPAFVSEVSVDAYNDQCLSLDNNLYDARNAPICGGYVVVRC